MVITVVFAAGYIFQISFALKPLPKDFRAETEVFYYFQDDAELFNVEEVVRSDEGSIRLRVTNVTDPDKKKSETVAYYRINEHLVQYDKLDGRILALNPDKDQCSTEFLSVWSLANMTRILKTLMLSDGIELGSLETDRVSVGPIAFARLIDLNKHLFKLDSKGFDEIRLTDVFYFSADFQLGDGVKLVRFITLLPTSRVNNPSTLEIGRTMLSQVATDGYAVQIGLIFLDKINDRIALKKKSSVLLDYFGSEYETLLISYNTVQELSLTKHLGTSADEGVDANPFALPAASRCGSVSSHLPFFADAKQFSGVLYAKHIHRETYIAYDSLTNHLRVDSVGQHKIIYDLDNNRATMIADPTMINKSGKLGIEYQEDKNTKSISSKRGDRADKNHCSEISIVEGRSSSRLADNYVGLKSLVEVLGLGSAAIYYLGVDTLEDGLTAHKFEREVSLNDLPIVVALNLRIYPPSSGKLTLVYYFASEVAIMDFDSFNIFEVDAFKSMWLRRVVLLSSNELSKHKTTLSEITFIHSSWNLELKPDRDQGREASIMTDAVHTFDIGSECKSQTKQLKLEYVMSARDVGEALFNYVDQPPPKKRSDTDAEFIRDQDDDKSTFESLEEGLISFTSRRLSLPRSHINKLQIFEPIGSEVEYSSLLVSATISSQLNYETNYRIVGWVEDFNSLDNRVQMVVRRASMPLSECILTIGTVFRERTTIQSVHCPYLGCGYVIPGVRSLQDVLKRPDAGMQEPSIILHHDMCTIYTQERSITSGLLDKNISEKTIKKAIENSLVYIDLGSTQSQASTSTNEQNTASNSIKQVIFRAKVSKVALSDVVLHESYGEQLAKGSCYSSQTAPIHPESAALRKESLAGIPIKTIELNFDAHHSIYHCHQACQLYSPCQTYSYSPQRQKCALSNISKNFNRALVQVDPEMTDVRPLTNLYLDDPKCMIYAINSAKLYTPMQQVLTTTPGILANRRHFVSLGSLNECADLCHSYEIVESASLKYKCTKFQHSLLESICAIYDSDSYLFEQLRSHLSETTKQTIPPTSLEYSKGLMNIDDWAKISHFGTYSRDYVSLYNVEYSVEVSVTERQEFINQLASKSTIYDLDYDDCLRECSVVNLDCVMVDFCFNPVKHVPMKRCKIYTIRSPYALHVHSNPIKLGKSVHVVSDELNDNEAQLTELEEKFYLKEKISSNYTISVSDGSCIHNYLSGDNLYLKREIWKTLQASKVEKISIKEEPILNLTSLDEDQRKASERISVKLHNIAKLLDQSFKSQQTSRFWATTLQILFGSSIGLLVFAYVGNLSFNLDEVYETVSIRAMLASLFIRVEHSFSGRETRSESQVEFREMDLINRSYANGNTDAIATLS